MLDYMNVATQKRRYKLTWQQSLPYVLLVAGLVGLTASFFLTLDKIDLLQNPSFQPACNINPIISCSAVMKTAQASTFGVPNSIFGLIAFSALCMFAVALLAGATFKRWLWLCVQAVATAGILAVHYLFFEDVFRIHAICPWCFSVWMVTIPAFFGITIYNIRAGNLGTSRTILVAKVVKSIGRHSNDLLVLWYLAIFGVLLIKFWYYWQTLLR